MVTYHIYFENINQKKILIIITSPMADICLVLHSKKNSHISLHNLMSSVFCNIYTPMAFTRNEA